MSIRYWHMCAVVGGIWKGSADTLMADHACYFLTTVVYKVPQEI